LIKSVQLLCLICLQTTILMSMGVIMVSIKMPYPNFTKEEVIQLEELYSTTSP
jgi:hypothetical protein